MTDDQLEIFLKGELVQYSVRHSQEATEPRIDVGIHSTRVVIPEGDAVDPEALLSENADWVLEKRHKYDRYRAMSPVRVFEPGEVFPFLDEPHVLAVRDISESHVGDGEICLAQEEVDRTTIRTELEALYRHEARRHLRERVATFAGRMRVEPGKVEFRNQRTRWGSCSPKETLSFNWRLIMASPEVIDYVVVHELAHLRIQKHTRRFWRLVREQVPNYSEHVEWLKENSARLIFDATDL